MEAALEAAAQEREAALRRAARAKDAAVAEVIKTGKQKYEAAEAQAAHALETERECGLASERNARKHREANQARPTLAFTRYFFTSSRSCTNQSFFHSSRPPALATLLQ